MYDVISIRLRPTKWFTTNNIWTACTSTTGATGEKRINTLLSAYNTSNTEKYFAVSHNARALILKISQVSRPIKNFSGIVSSFENRPDSEDTPPISKTRDKHVNCIYIPNRVMVHWVQPTNRACLLL